VTGLDLALEWGLITFAVNYIPFLGPLAATFMPTLLAIAQFESVRAQSSSFSASI
jgi:predicted PurR-regulated permease PerM